MEHTKGKLRVQDDDEYSVLVAEGAHPDDSMAHVWTKPDARRLVACWNACEGISTEDIEHGVVPPVDKRIYARIEKERGELMATLQGVLAWHDGSPIVNGRVPQLPQEVAEQARTLERLSRNPVALRHQLRQTSRSVRP